MLIHDCVGESCYSRNRHIGGGIRQREIYLPDYAQAKTTKMCSDRLNEKLSLHLQRCGKANTVDT